MKKLIQFSLLFSLFAFAIACSNAPEGEKVTAEEAQEAPAETAAAGVAYVIDSTQSIINWTGTKPGGAHTGTIALSAGSLTVTDDAVSGGTFTIDMNSMKNTDLPAEKQGDLVGHLSSGDFFEVEKFPTGSFDITGVAATSDVVGATHTVTGNLTMKGVSKSVSIPANINVTEKAVTAVTPAFTINRTEWGINYGSTVIGTLKDKAINDEIGLVLQLVANPAPAQ